VTAAERKVNLLSPAATFIVFGAKFVQGSAFKTRLQPSPLERGLAHPEVSTFMLPVVGDDTPEPASIRAFMVVCPSLALFRASLKRSSGICTIVLIGLFYKI
jgi:hypothetical protein